MGAKKKPQEKNIDDKLLIKELLERIAKKLQDKETAKKAAMIIKDWIDKK